MRYQELYDKGVERLRKVGMDQYLDLGAETRSQNRINREYMDSLTFRMRILGSQPADTGTKVFGIQLSSPIAASAMCTSRVLERLGPWETHYLELIAGGLADAGSLMSTGDVEFDLLARIIDQGAPVIHMVKPFDDDDKIIDQLHKAEELGCVAVGMDIDCFFKEKAWDEVPGPEYLTHKSMDQMAEFCSATKLPFIVKGVLGVEDAQAAKELGAAGIVVSFHGGEAIDYAAPIHKMLPAIRAQVPDLLVLADSGFRRGTDVLKALACGADAVGVVTLLLVACAADGREGVRLMMQHLEEELQRTMSFVGTSTVQEIDESILVQV